CAVPTVFVLGDNWWAGGACHRARIRATRWLCPPYLLLRSGLHLNDRPCRQLVDLHLELRRRDGDAVGVEIGLHLAEGTAAGSLDIGGDDFPGVGGCGLSRPSKQRSHPQAEQAVAARFGLE